MVIETLKQELAICKLRALPAGDCAGEFFFIAKTDTEVSLVCHADRVPADTEACDTGWKALRVRGVLEFSLTGILAELTGVLAAKNIAVFAVSTYDTDYILVKTVDEIHALSALRSAGHTIADLY